MERFAWSLPILRTSTYITTQPASPARRDTPTGSAKSPFCWARRQTITDPAHKAAALALSRAAAHRPSVSDPDEVVQRDLGAFDAAFGLTEVVC
ncbi:hypothetical protein CBP52_16755 [Cellulomonas sp. PSBB021]|nr:hypothetical protein CBP52_16755 [Cellulomonas sp. PSBB021]